MRNAFQIADDVDLIRGRNHIIFGVEAFAMQMDEINISVSPTASGLSTGPSSNDALADFMLGRPSLLAHGESVPDRAAPEILGRVRAGRHAAGEGTERPRRRAMGAVASGTRHTGARVALLDACVPGGPEVQRLPERAGRACFFTAIQALPRSYANGNWAGFRAARGHRLGSVGKGYQSLRASYGIFFDDARDFYGPGLRRLGAVGKCDFALTAPAGRPRQSVSRIPRRQSVSAALPARPERAISRRRAVHHLPAEPAPHVSAAVGPELPAPIHRELAGYRGLPWEQGDPLADFHRGEPRGVYSGQHPRSPTHSSGALLNLMNPVQGAFYSNITLADDGVNTNYNALRVSAQHRFSHNFTVLSVYTWSHCLQNAETYGNRNSLGSAQYQNPNNRNRGLRSLRFRPAAQLLHVAGL